MEDRKAFRFYKSYANIVEELSDVDAGIFTKAIISKEFYNIEPKLEGILKVLYSAIKHSIDGQVEGFINAKKRDYTFDPTMGGNMGGNKAPTIAPTMQEEEEEKEKEKEEEEEEEEEKVKVKTKKEYSDEIKNFTRHVYKYFDKYFLPKNEKTFIAWNCEIDRLMRIEELSFDEIEKAIKNGRSDNFWQNQFKSITKLRKKNRDGELYVLQFLTMRTEKEDRRTNTGKAIDNIDNLMNEIMQDSVNGINNDNLLN